MVILLLAEACHFDPLPDLIENGTFESGSCAFWAPIDSVATAVRMSHQGTWACKVCYETRGLGYTLDDNPSSVFNPRAGDVYVAEGWVRQAPDRPAMNPVALRIREWIVNEEVEGPTTPSDYLTLDATWKALRVRHTVTANQPSLDVYVGGGGPDGCFLVDDIVLYRTE